MKQILFISFFFLFLSSSLFSPNLLSQGDELQSSMRGGSDSYKKVPQELKVKTSKFFNFLLDSNVTDAYKELM